MDWTAWTQSPPGLYALAWEQAQLDRVVSDIFGYHALQLGLPQVDALRENRMSSRALLLDANSGASAPYAPPRRRAAHTANLSIVTERTTSGLGPPANRQGADPAAERHSGGPLRPHAPEGRSTVWCDFLELPLEAQSVDLLVLPHTLEFTRDPHHLLREAERVLMPEGQLIIVGFNSLSLWGMRQSVGRMTGKPFVPAAHDLIAFTRLKDWIKLLGFELDRGRFGCYRPPLATDKWLGRCDFMEAAGDRWWPIFGATYMVTAIKRVRGMRLIGPKWTIKPALAPLTPVAAPQIQGQRQAAAPHGTARQRSAVPPAQGPQRAPAPSDDAAQDEPADDDLS